jgi:hypothetical protein
VVCGFPARSAQSHGVRPATDFVSKQTGFAMRNLASSTFPLHSTFILALGRSGRASDFNPRGRSQCAWVAGRHNCLKKNRTNGSKNIQTGQMKLGKCLTILPIFFTKSGKYFTILPNFFTKSGKYFSHIGPPCHLP